MAIIFFRTAAKGKNMKEQNYKPYPKRALDLITNRETYEIT
jgi:hypothetical protein